MININLLGLDTLNRLFTSKSQTASPINFVTLYYTYQSFVPNAVTSNLMRVTNGQLFDVAGRSQSPYMNNDLFAVAPLQQAAFIGSNQIIFSSSLFFGNTGKTISSIQVDPKGTGSYQTVSLNVPTNVTYDTSGFYTVNIKIIYTDGTTKLSHTKLTIYSSANGALAFNKNKFAPAFEGTGPPYWEKPFIFGNHYPYVPQSISATKPYLGVLGQGDYTIDLSVNNTTGKIKKPLIIVDGFDPDGSFTYLGAQNYLDRITYDVNFGYPSYYTHPIPLNGTNGLDNADSYDIVYLHWKNGTDYIQRNAYLLESLIQYINAQKAANGSVEQNVILGFSMGGLITRYALRDMELNNIAHQTRLFISHDVPYWGANVPVAAQAAVQQLAPWKIINLQGSGSFPFFQISYPDLIPSAVDGLNLFNSPAAKQMLIQRYLLSPITNTLSADNSVHTSFMNEINSMGWPLTCRNITLSNGACNGTKIYPDNSNIAQISGNRPMSYFGSLWRSLALSISGILDATTVLTGGPGHPIINGYAMIWQFPLALFSTKNSIGINFSLNSVPLSGISRIYTGDVYSTKKILGLINVTNYFISAHVNSTSDMLPLDNAPGGEYSLTQFGFDASQIQSSLPAFFQGYIHTVITQPNFCFVPTVSSLAITNPQQNLFTNVCSNINCLNPTQVSDYYAPQVNQLHVSYTIDNSNWILQRQDANFNCVKICSANLSISGDNNFCTISNNYTISNLPAGATVFWSVIPSAIATPNTPYALQTTLNGTGNSLITLNASITNSCSPATINSANIVVGKVAPGPITFPLIDPTLGKLQAQVDPVPGATSYNWYKNGVLQTGHGGAIQMPITRNQCNVYYDISVESISICGISLQTHAEAYVPPCNNAFSVSPNPASNSINVSPVVGNSQLSANSAIDEIRVYDVQGNLKKDQKFGKAASASMNIQGLTNGSYYVEIISGSYSEKHQLVIQN